MATPGPTHCTAIGLAAVGADPSELVGGTGIEPVTSSVSAKPGLLLAVARCALHQSLLRSNQSQVTAMPTMPAFCLATPLIKLHTRHSSYPWMRRQVTTYLEREAAELHRPGMDEGNLRTGEHVRQH